MDQKWIGLGLIAAGAAFLAEAFLGTDWVGGAFLIGTGLVWFLAPGTDRPTG